MNKTRFHGLRLLGAVATCMTAMSAYAAAPVVETDPFALRDTNHFDPDTIDAVGDKVADWQLANLDNLSDYMRNYRDNIADRRGWHHGALYVGMMNWAFLPGNGKYEQALRQISEENEWKLGDRLFHGDDHVVGQLVEPIQWSGHGAQRGVVGHRFAEHSANQVAHAQILEGVRAWCANTWRCCRLASVDLVDDVVNFSLCSR